MIWVYIIIGVLVGAGVCYWVMRPIHKLDVEIAQKNGEIQEQLRQMEKDLAVVETKCQALKKTKSTIEEDINIAKERAKKDVQETYDMANALMQEQMSQSAEMASKRYREAEAAAKEQYLNLLQETQAEYGIKVDEFNALEKTIENFKEKVKAANEAELRRLAEEDEKNYYKIKISDDQLWDIKVLRDAVKELKGDPLAVNKVIWEVYYKRPVTDLLNRLAPSGSNKTGIYKITNLNNNRCYIGQSVDIRTRIRDHIKAGVGIGAANNRFYSEMKVAGPECFMYEIIEECERSRLDECERFWIEYFQSADYGFNSTRGNEVKND